MAPVRPPPAAGRGRLGPPAADLPGGRRTAARRSSRIPRGAPDPRTSHRAGLRHERGGRPRDRPRGRRGRGARAYRPPTWPICSGAGVSGAWRPSWAGALSSGPDRGFPRGVRSSTDPGPVRSGSAGWAGRCLPLAPWPTGRSDAGSSGRAGSFPPSFRTLNRPGCSRRASGLPIGSAWPVGPSRRGLPGCGRRGPGPCRRCSGTAGSPCLRRPASTRNSGASLARRAGRRAASPALREGPEPPCSRPTRRPVQRRSPGGPALPDARRELKYGRASERRGWRPPSVASAAAACRSRGQ